MQIKLQRNLNKNMRKEFKESSWESINYVTVAEEPLIVPAAADAH